MIAKIFNTNCFSAENAIENDYKYKSDDLTSMQEILGIVVAKLVWHVHAYVTACIWCFVFVSKIYRFIDIKVVHASYLMITFNCI